VCIEAKAVEMFFSFYSTHDFPCAFFHANVGITPSGTCAFGFACAFPY
jgi:hypothetical protein